MTSDIDWDQLLTSTPDFTDDQLDEIAETWGWLVTYDGKVQDFDEFREPYERIVWGDGGTHQNPRELWARSEASGHVYMDIDDAYEVAKETRKLREAEKRKRERDKAGYIDWDDPDFWDPPDPKVIVPRMALEGQVCEIYSPGGVGKSLLALDVVLGLTLRGDTFGESVDATRVIYLDRENSKRGLSKRLKAFGASRATSKVLTEALHYSLLGDVPSLDTVDGGEWLMREVGKTQATCIVIDTMSKVVDGEENSNDTWKGLHNKSLTRLRAAGVTVILLDHVGKDSERGPRGGSAKRDNCDVMWSLDRYGVLPSGEEVFELVNRKDREGDFGGEGTRLHLVREETSLLRHRWATNLELVAATATAITGAAAYAKLVREIAESNPARAFSVRDMVAEVRSRRGSATEPTVREAFKKLKDDGLVSPKGQWLGVADGAATDSLRATE